MAPAEKVVEVLVELTRSFTHEKALEDLLQEIVDAAHRLLPSNHASVRIFDDRQDELLCSARTGEGADSRPMSFKKGEGVIGWVADYGRVANVADTEKDPRFKPARAQGFHVRSVLAVPITLGDQVLGVLAVSAAVADVFTARDEAILQLLANCSVPVIQKARLEQMSPFDELTLAFKEMELVPRLEREMSAPHAREFPLSVLHMGLDGLGLVYQSHGFEVGNQVLRRFADRVRDVSHSTHLLVRRGVDGFVAILPETSPGMARHVAELIRDGLEAKPLDIGEDERIPQTASIGIATWTGVESAGELLDRVAGALSVARKVGGNQFVVAERTNAQI